MRQTEGYWSKSSKETLESVQSSPEGLSPSEAKNRLAQFGPNRLAKERSITFWGVFKEEVTEPMILLLFVVGIVYGIWGELRDSLTIMVIIILLVFTEIFTEYRAKKAVYVLRKIAPPTASILRNGIFSEIPTFDIVKGDILVLEVGVKVPADARVIESYGLETDESPLTGESVPVAKEDKVLPSDYPLAERINMVYAGTTVTRGRGKAVVVATGMQTELGKVTGLVLEAKEPKTPLQTAMKQLAGLLVWVAVGFSVVIPVIGLIQGKPLKEMVLTGLSLSFATIPEELPIVITMVLGVGALALSRKHVLIRRLKAAETLGDVTVIVTDKTGTLTENKMSLVGIVSNSTVKTFSRDSISGADRLLLKIGLLTSNVKKTGAGSYAGDPMEIAIVESLDKPGIPSQELSGGLRLLKEFSFDNRRKMMSMAYQSPAGDFVFVKGAPEMVLAKSSKIMHENQEMGKYTSHENAVRAQVETMAADAMRVIAFAYKKAAVSSKLTQQQAESDLVFVGLMGFIDPPRAGVKEAIEAVTGAGIRTIVVSGDHSLTVEKVASVVGIRDGQKSVSGAQLESMDDRTLAETVARTSLFARTTAEQKLKIVKSLREQGHIVAVTGDGINDAPALKSADIGIAMGETGTEVARETADMVLTDDSFISIAAGVREGRKMFDNLKKGITYYLSVKVALVLSFVVALILSIPFPFAPIQIIILELFMDLAASATFVSEPIEDNVMTRPPRPPKEKFVNRGMVQRIFIAGVCLSAAVVFNYLLVWYTGKTPVQAQSIAFATWLVGHIFLAFNMRSDKEPLWKIGLFSNKIMLIWTGVVGVFLAVVTTVPQIQVDLKLTSLDLRSWLLAVGVPFVAVFWMELRKLVNHKRN